MLEKITTSHTPDSIEEQIKLYMEGRAEEMDAYARYGYKEEREWEKKLAEEIGVADTAVMNSGMAAIHTAIEAEIKAGETVLCSKDVYDCTKDLFKDLNKRGGIKVKIINPTDTQEIEKLTESLKPSCIILESVANAKEMRVADLDEILKITEKANQKYKEKYNPEFLLEKRLKTRFKEKYDNLSSEDRQDILESIKMFKETNNYFCFRKIIKQIASELNLDKKEVINDLADVVKYITNNEKEKLSLIIDNTLPSPQLYNPLEEVDEKSLTNVVVVESGTKHYQLGEDKITLGLAYSNNPEKIKEIKKTRTTIGTYLQPSSLKEMPENSLTGMKEKMNRHSENALMLAQELSELPNVEAVYHPNLPEHPDKELADKFAPQGIVTLFYADLKIGSMEFVKKAYEKANGKIKIGGSFGHPDTWILPLGEKTIRIAAGSEDEKEAEEIREILKEILE